VDSPPVGEVEVPTAPLDVSPPAKALTSPSAAAPLGAVSPEDRKECSVIQEAAPQTPPPPVEPEQTGAEPEHAGTDAEAGPVAEEPGTQEEAGSESATDDESDVAFGDRAKSAGAEREPPLADTATDVERQRQERIRQNLARMAELGLMDAADEMRNLVEREKRPRGRQGRGKKTREPRPTEVRRSTRNRGGATPGSLNEEAIAALAVREREPTPEPPEFVNSDVLRYCCGDGAEAPDTGSAVTIPFPPSRMSAGAESSAPFQAYRDTGAVLVDSSLSRAYSIDCLGGLIAAGGHQGRFSVWGAQGVVPGAEVEPLLSGKLFRGWVCDVRLLRHGDAGKPSLMLAASNDGVVGLFDLTQEHGGRPLGRWEDASLHNGGVFSLDEQALRVATASKDGTVCLSRVDLAGGLAQERRWDDAHDGGVVKSVRFQPGGGAQVLGTAGNDGCVKVWDARGAGAGPAVSMAAHDSCANSLEWHPSDDNLVVTAGFDPEAKVFDVRSPSVPLHVLRGHCRGGRVSKIYRPVFVDGGRHIVASGPGTDALTVFSTAAGTGVSQGDLGFLPTALAAFADPAAPLLLGTTKALQVFVPSHTA